MKAVYIKKARYIKDFKIFLEFNTKETGEVDLKDIIYKYEAAKPLRNPVDFSKFYLDPWATLAWDCGFDIAPEALYLKATGKIENRA
ncbi:MAG: DUF2442 domain-containing protein [Deltaproteobacteria bacterium]|nr:DUF2442 domain-containing protein [Deltaproteobacteria bacterium]